MSILGSFLFAFLMIVRIDQILRSGVSLLGLLLAAQAGIAAFWMIYRHPTSRNARISIQVMSWCSAILPLAMQPTNTGLNTLVAAPGLLFALWAMWSLGASFSIAPAARKLVVRGPYRFIRHPMYAGELLSLCGACIAAFSVWNSFVFAVFLISIYKRIIKEESLFEHYSIYSRCVMWRLLPGVW